MARFRKFDPRFWKDEGIRKLQPLEKLTAAYCITGQSNRIGLFNFSPGQAVEDLETSPETFAKGFAKVCETLNFGWDESARVLYLPTWWKYNCPENPNVLKACLADLHEVPQTRLSIEFSANLAYLPEIFHETFRETLAKGLPKPCPNQEQEKEQEKEQEQKTATRIVAAWNALGSPFPQIKKLTPDRTRHLSARLKEHGLEGCEQALEAIRDSVVCKGENRSGWIADFDWFVKTGNIVKVLEGKYARAFSTNGKGGDATDARIVRIANERT